MKQAERELRSKIAEIETRNNELEKELLEETEEKRIEEVSSEFKGNMVKLNMLNQRFANLSDEELRNKNSDLADNYKELPTDGETRVEGNIYATEEYRDIFYKTHFGQEISDTEKRWMGTNVPPQTGESSALSVVPTTTIAKIQERLELMSVLYRDVSKSFFTGNMVLPIEKLTTGLPANRFQGAQIVNLDFEIDHLNFSQFILSAMTSLSVEAEIQSVVQLETFVVSKLSKRLATKIEQQIWTGSGNNQIEGITTARIQRIEVPIDITNADELLDLTGLVDPQMDFGMKFYFHKTSFTEIKKLKDDAGNYLVNPVTEAGKRIFDEYPVQYAQVIKPWRTAAEGEPIGLLANLSEGYHLNIGQNPKISKSSDFFFDRNLDAFKINFMGDGKSINPDAIFILTKRTGTPLSTKAEPEKAKK